MSKKDFFFKLAVLKSDFEGSTGYKAITVVNPPA
jgi:hypothetical protein